MQKKFLSILLIFALFFSLALPAAAAEAEGGILEVSGGAQPLSVVQSGQQSKRPWDYIGETSLIEAMPATRDLAVKLPSNVNLFFLLRDNGSANTYFCIEIYSKDSTEPLAKVTDAFPGVYGIYTYEVLWRTQGFATGSYRVVMYSATRSGETYTPIAGTQSEVVVLLTDWWKSLESITLVDPDTRKEVSVAGTSINEGICLERVDFPSYDTFSSALDYVHSSNIDVEEIGGLVFITPKSFGWASVKVEGDNNIELYQFTVEVCINSGGHINQEIIRIAPKEGKYDGVLLHVCPDCGCSYLETEESYEAALSKFVDIPSDQWYYNGVKAMVLRGLFNGVSTHHFRPDHLMTRAMLVTVLWRYAGAPEAGSAAFTDVPDGQWYSQAVNWAAEQGVVSGIGKGKFDPDGNVTREQMATILYRYAKLCGFDTALDADALSDFPDKDQASDYALEPLQWAVSNGIINGTKTGSKTLLDPRGFATRAQLAVILARYIDKYDPDPATLPIPNLDQALEHGSVWHSTWAFFPDGTLVIGGSDIPDFNSGPWGVAERPWEHLADQVTRLEVREGVYHVGQSSFLNFTALTEVQLPSTLRIIDNDAFGGCTSLEQIAIPQGTRYLGQALFKGCTALKEVVFPDTIYQAQIHTYNYYGNAMFNGCTSLETVTLPLAMQSVSAGMFRDCTSLKKVNFGIGIQGIREAAFANCTSLEALVLPFTARIIYDKAFDGCTSLDAIVISNPYAEVIYSRKDSEGNPVYKAPFGDREITTVYAFSGTKVAEIAVAEGYDFVPLESLIE